MKDLEIRGAGNVLGADQSGHMEAVGYDLYCKMLNDAIKVQKGEAVEESFDTTIQLPFDAFIPADYVKNEFIKLDLYKRISQISSEEDYEDLIDEISDRFGELPKETVNLLDISLIKAHANKAYITSIVLAGAELRFGMFVNAHIDTDRINDMLDKYRGAMKFVVGRSPTFVLKTKKLTEKEIWKQVREVVSDIGELAATK
jgi:transcription-repair coupling factor (superfamily II helicase)